MGSIVLTGVSLGIVAFLAGVVLFAASKKFAVKENPLIDEVNDMLPAANCGGCGFAGCRSFAEEFVNTRDTDLNCPVAGSDLMAEIAAKVGVELPDGPRMIARVMCFGGLNARREGVYKGIRSCSAVSVANTVDLLCSHGCMGYGDCEAVCPFDCIEMVDGVAVINEEKCTGCGICIKACPRNVIKFTPYKKKIFVSCSSTDKGPAVRKACSVGCIGCMACKKVCEYDAIDIKNFLAEINPDLCTECGACIEKCPVNCIVANKSEIGAAVS